MSRDFVGAVGDWCRGMSELRSVSRKKGKEPVQFVGCRET